MVNTIDGRIKYLKYMDFVVRCVNDEENGVFEDWLALGVPDGASYDDLHYIAEHDEQYSHICELFAELLSHLIATGEWNEAGYSTELWSKVPIDARDVCSGR